MDNRAGYGFRFKRSRWGRSLPNVVAEHVASAESFDVNSGAANVRLRKGDPVHRITSGGITLSAGTENTTIPPKYIVMGIGPYFDGSQMVVGGDLPSDTTWGTLYERRTKIWVCPVEEAFWEIDANNQTSTTEAAYRLLVGTNANHVLTGATGALHAYPKLDMATAAVTESLAWRIEDISDTVDNIDFTGANVKLVVTINIAGVNGVAGLAAVSKGV